MPGSPHRPPDACPPMPHWYGQVVAVNARSATRHRHAPRRHAATNENRPRAMSARTSRHVTRPVRPCLEKNALMHRMMMIDGRKIATTTETRAVAQREPALFSANSRVHRRKRRCITIAHRPFVDGSATWSTFKDDVQARARRQRAVIYRAQTAIKIEGQRCARDDTKATPPYRQCPPITPPAITACRRFSTPSLQAISHNSHAAKSHAP